MSRSASPSHVSDETLVAAVEAAWEECDRYAVNGYLCRDQVAEYCALSPKTLQKRLRQLADAGAIAAAFTLDLRTYTETRAVAPVEAER